MRINSEAVVSNFLWRFLERCGAQIISFIVSIVLARLLAPEVYGTVALVTVFTTVLQVFVDSGMGTVLIQKKDADELDFSTVFYFNCVICVLLYIVMFFVAPVISSFYEMPDLTSVVRVVSIVLLISGVKNIQQAYVSRHMLFKRFFFSTLGGTIVSAFAGIIMAYMGCGVWALVAQYIGNMLIDTIILWITVPWRPQFQFSFKRLKCLFNFAWKILVSSLLENVYTNLRSLLIGKYFTTSELAYFNRGQQFPNLVIANINTSLDSVLLPALSAEQDDKKRIKAMTSRALKTSTYIMFPAMIGMAVCSKAIVTILLTDKWIFCAPYMQVFCLAFALYPIHTANLNAIKAMGRSDVFLKLEVVKKIVGLTLLIVSLRFGVFYIAIGFMLESLISVFINTYPMRKLIGYSLFEQLKDIFPQFILTMIMGIIIFFVGKLSSNMYFTLIIQVILGVIIYIIGSKFLNIEAFIYSVSLIKNKRNRGKKYV